MTRQGKTAWLLGFILLGGLAVPAAAQPVAERGPAVLQAETSDDNLQWAASVTGVDALAQEPEPTKLFGVTGGDPAMNGLYTYLAFFIHPGDGWRVFKIGDFLDYSIQSQRPGRLVLDINESVMDSETNISARRRRIEIRWTRGRDGSPPARVTVRTIPG